MKRVAVAFMAAGFLLPVSGWAQDDEDPGRGVARISLMNGDVSVRRGDSGDFVAATVNAPLVVQDQLLTGANSRAEVQFDWANMLRLSGNTEIRFAELETRRYQVQLSSGTVTHRVLRDSDAEVEINTPSISVRPIKKGAYRVTVLPNGDTEVTVRSGEAEVYSPRGVERVKSGRTMLARGSASDPEFQMVSAIPRDEWDQWNERRDRDLDRSRSYEYVSRDIYGADDLDSHGRWVYAAPYGWVWTPYGVSAGWAPYREGRWAWVDWYGWTWVSYEPWGWAPYHYGRWFYNAPYGWCWYPGAMRHRHYWAPGLVAFFGWGHGVHVGIGFGSVGWVPLAPYETYHRWYGRGYYGGGYRNHNVRIVNNVNITNVYRNARHNGITGLDGDGFARGGRGRHLRDSDIPDRRANLVQGAIPVTPGRESLRLSNREVAGTPRVTGRDRFFSRRQPAAVERVSFEEQRRGMDRMVRTSFGDRDAAGRGRVERASETPAGGGNIGRMGAAERSQGGWRRMGEAPSTRQGEQAAPAGGDAWQRSGRGMREERGGQATRQTEAGRPADSDTWRRFGTGRTERQVAAPEQSRPADNGNWRRFETGRTERQVAAPEQSRGAEAQRPADTGNWRRFEPRGRQDSGAREVEAPRYDRGGGWMNREPRSEQRSEPRYTAPRSEPLHINPPIVRERSVPRFEGGDRGGRQSMRMSAPEMRGGGGGPARMSAPESRGGGGRSESRGGGGGRSESRGGGRGRR